VLQPEGIVFYSGWGWVDEKPVNVPTG